MADNFKKFVEGKSTITIEEDKFDISLKAQERLTLLNFLTHNAKITETKISMSQNHFDQISEILFNGFKRCNPEIEDESIKAFVDELFENIIAALSIEYKWIPEGGQKKQN